MKLLIWLAANTFNLIGAAAVGLGMPFGWAIISREWDLIFIPIGILLLGISYYYKFVFKN